MASDQKNIIKKYDDNCELILPRLQLERGNGPNTLFVQTREVTHCETLHFESDHFHTPAEPIPSTHEEFSPNDSLSTRCYRKDEDFEDLSPLSYGIELSAGPGHVRKKSVSKKSRTPLPSETLLFSAAVFKSFFTMQDQKTPVEREFANSEGDESVKNKMMMLWHNVKYGWSSGLKTNFSKETPVNMLGKIYHSQFTKCDGRFSNLEGFKKDFNSLVWFTYRSKFSPLPNSSLTSDCGWGCMIRSGQMLIATALRHHFLPFDWYYDDAILTPADIIHKSIIKWFSDCPGKKYPFSLHNLIECGHKKAGSWFGPSCVAYMMKEAMMRSGKEFPSLQRIGVYVAQDRAAYVQDILDICDVGRCLCSHENKEVLYKELRDKSSSSSYENGHSFAKSEKTNVYSSWERIPDGSYEESIFESSLHREYQIPLDYFVNDNRKRSDESKDKVFGDALCGRLDDAPPENDGKIICTKCHGWKSCIVLIPVRLGGSCVNPIYYNCIYSLFLHDLCIGIIGGKPKHSLYFVGVQEDNLIYLDPHRSQDFISPDCSDFPLSSFHCPSPRKLSISKMDPSATVGFYCHTKKDFFRLLEEIPGIVTAKDGKLDSPIFEFVDGRSEEVSGWLDKTISEETVSSP